MIICLRMTQLRLRRTLINMMIILSFWLCQVSTVSASTFEQLSKAIVASLDRDHLFSPARRSALGYFIQLKNTYAEDVRIARYEAILVEAFAREFDELLMRTAYADAALLISKVERISPNNKTVIAMQNALVIATAAMGVYSTSQEFVQEVDKKQKVVSTVPANDKEEPFKKSIQHDSAIKKSLSKRKSSLEYETKLKQKESLTQISNDWLDASTLSETLDTFYLRSRNSLSSTEMIEGALKPVCENIVQQNASIKIHTVSEKDYRWLMVKLMLCTRKINKKFWLRHSYVVSQSNFLKVTLHPRRDVALSLTQSKL